MCVGIGPAFVGTGGHYELAAEALAHADPRRGGGGRGWLADLITRQEPLGQWADAYTRRPYARQYDLELRGRIPVGGLRLGAS